MTTRKKILVACYALFIVALIGGGSAFAFDRPAVVKFVNGPAAVADARPTSTTTIKRSAPTVTTGVTTYTTPVTLPDGTTATTIEPTTVESLDTTTTVDPYGYGTPDQQVDGTSTTTAAPPRPTTTVQPTTTTTRLEPTTTSTELATTTTSTTQAPLASVVEPLPADWQLTSPCHGSYEGECLVRETDDGHPIVYDPLPYPGWPNPPVS